MTREERLNASLVTLIETMIDEAADTLSKMNLSKTAITNNEKRAYAFATLFIAKMNYDAGQMSLSEEAPILDDTLKNTRVYFSAKEDVGPYLLAFEPYGCEDDIKKISFAEYENYKDLLDMSLKLSPGEDEFVRKIAKESVEKVILNYCEKVKARIPFAAQNVMMIQSYREFLKDFQKTADIEKTGFLKVKKFEDFLAKKQEFVLSSTEISNSLKKNAFSQIFEKNKDSDLSLEF